MEIWKRNTSTDILKSLESELAKAVNEVNCAKKDVQKASSRIAFCLTAIHELKHRDIQE
jgi:hypothetical protein